MLNKNQERDLAYLVRIDTVNPIPNYDRIEVAIVGGWTIVCGKGEFKAGDLGVYFEIDSLIPAVKPFSDMEFLVSKKYRIKTQAMCKGTIHSQGLLVPIKAFEGWEIVDENTVLIGKELHCIDDESRFLTKLLNVIYYEPEDNFRKSNDKTKEAKYTSMCARHKKLAKTKIWSWLMKRNWGKKLLFTFFGKKKDSPKGWPKGKFPGVSVTDQERCENMTWVLTDKTPYIRTQKCDGSSGTYILERKGKNKFEFYVCSRNVRQADQNQKCFYDENYYWEMAFKYNIENKMKAYLKENPDIWFVCWQGEICGPKIQSNPHNLKENHFYGFHMIDSKTGRFDIREAAEIWKKYEIEVVPIDEDLYILPDDFEEFKLSADGYYDKAVCEGNNKCAREGYVYYKSTDPTFSFKNVSRKYLEKH